MLNRRELLRLSSIATILATSGIPLSARTDTKLKFGKPAPFTFQKLCETVQKLSHQPFTAPTAPADELLDQIDYDAHGKIRFKSEKALWAEGPGLFPVTFFHLGRFFRSPVRMYAVTNGAAQEIIYDKDDFLMPEDSPAQKFPENTGFAGFRFQESREGSLDWRKNDWVAFLGASYFRAIGELYQYGLSARGLALNTAVHEKTEEFPLFTRFYFETPEENSHSVTICALLDSPSVVGAFRFTMQRTKNVIMDIETFFILRQNVDRLGICPLTSMYWYSEQVKPGAIDWRPEIHDSDGLALWTGAGERLWRPLNNPPQISASAFMDENPKGFGLLQRDRSFDHYQDGVRYEQRPSLWVEPLHAWGKGSVQLIEIPTDDEIHDNIVAMWVPAQPARAGQSFSLRYRMYWTDREPFPTPLAECKGTRLGRGGNAGQNRPDRVRKIVTEFYGEPLKTLASGVIPEAVLSASQGNISNILVEAVPDGIAGHWRVLFDIAETGSDPVDLRGYLRNGTDILSETWLYQLHP